LYNVYIKIKFDLNLENDKNMFSFKKKIRNELKQNKNTNGMIVTRDTTLATSNCHYHVTRC